MILACKQIQICIFFDDCRMKGLTKLLFLLIIELYNGERENYSRWNDIGLYKYKTWVGKCILIFKT